MKRFILIVLDSFGVGAMDDVPEVRSQDLNSNTCLHLLEQSSKYRIELPNLMEMGLINALNREISGFEKSDRCLYGTSNLKHFGADSFYGHQEIAGTNPKMPVFHPLSLFINEICLSLEGHGFSVERLVYNDNELICVNNVIIVGDNMETDFGQAINVVGALDYCGFKMITEVGRIVRNIVKVPRVIAFGGSDVTIKDIKDAIISKNKFVGVDAPSSGVYKRNYHVEHMGYGIDETKQVSYALSDKNIVSNFYGKVANIVANPYPNNKDGVDTEEIFENLVADLKENKLGFYFANIQETDLAGHSEDSERYIDRLNVSDYWIGKIRALLNEDDILLITADHGNDPTIGHSKHTRERVPLLIDIVGRNKLNSPIYIGNRATLADIGQTVADYFNTHVEFGESFLDYIRKL
ncbi:MULTISPECIES: phosphopentomutase [Terrabacteria group]|uniref:phosphopentomutase n=1 Tax=Bacillati TaxID=1783272 RepID=UPI001C6E8A79|nr:MULTISPECIES: phosphopentomutase [Terrabacteria group]MBW9212989.1 phosphopentomutase [Trueperella sp. zg.1013]